MLGITIRDYLEICVAYITSLFHIIYRKTQYTKETAAWFLSEKLLIADLFLRTLQIEEQMFEYAQASKHHLNFPSVHDKDHIQQTNSIAAIGTHNWDNQNIWPFSYFSISSQLW